MVFLDMALIALINKTWEKANNEVFMYGSEHLPCLVIDCANFADPHRFYPDISLEQMQHMYVFELELLHRFRDVLRQLPLYAKRHQVQSVIVTTCDHLINYQDEQENRDIYQHAWELMRKMGGRWDIVAAVLRDSGQCHWARQFCHEIWENGYGAYRHVAKNGD